MKPCYCTLCGEQLTAPQFFEGNAYGWSCIKKVNPSAKKQKYIQISVLKIEYRMNHIFGTFRQGRYTYTMQGKVDNQGNFWVTEKSLVDFNRQLSGQRKINIESLLG